MQNDHCDSQLLEVVESGQVQNVEWKGSWKIYPNRLRLYLEELEELTGLLKTLPESVVSLSYRSRLTGSDLVVARDSGAMQILLTQQI